MTVRGWSRIDWLTGALVTLVGGAIRVRGLRSPGGMIFDEFYANDACFYLYSSPSLCDVPHEITAVHPPLGKWLIAAGIRLFGYDPPGWRIASVLAGTLTIAALYVLARKLLRSTLGAVVASGLLALDLLHFVMSRIAMLDVFVTFFSVLSFTCLAFDRDRLLEGGRADGVRSRPLGDRPWRLAAGMAAGAAAASKWSGWFTVAAVIVLTVVWELASRRRSGRGGSVPEMVREEGASIAIALIAAPVVVYTAAFAGSVEGSLIAWPWSDGSWLRAFVDRQVAMAEFHIPLAGDNPYSSPAWSWLLLKRPVVFYLFRQPDGPVREVLGTGNPLVWWSGVLALGYLAVRWARRRTPSAAEGVIVAGFVFAYGPWFVAGLLRQQLFMFYLLPAVPFMCLALGYVATVASGTLTRRAAVGALVLVSVAGFAFFYPVLSATPVPLSSWRSRVLFRDCGRPISPPIAVDTAGETPGDVSEPTAMDSGQPPEGWCWL
jgi:dolichyl-phosphate-mannose-protein mannosyltransferase